MFSYLLQAYLICLGAMVTLLPPAVHVSVGGLEGGCANGVFGWSILGPVVLISVSTSAELTRAMAVVSGTDARRARKGRRSRTTKGRWFYAGLIGNHSQQSFSTIILNSRLRLDRGHLVCGYCFDRGLLVCRLRLA